MTVLVTGWTSPLARTVIPHITDERVVGVGRTQREYSPLVDEVVAVDLGDRDRLTAAVDQIRPRVILHFGGMSGRYCESDPELARLVNVEASTALAEAAGEFGVERIVYSSTAAVYGTSYASPIAEDGPVDLTSHYAVTKYQAERAILRASERGGAQSIVMRIFNMWGSGFSDSLISKLCRSSPRYPLTLHGWDSFTRDYIHAFDVALAVKAAMSVSLASADSHRTYNIGSGNPLSNRELIERLEIEPGRYAVVDRPTTYSAGAVTLAACQLGFDPTIFPGAPRAGI